MFTVDTTIHEIAGKPEFKNRKYMTGAFTGIAGFASGFFKLKTMAKFSGWNAQDMADGMNHLYGQAQKGQVLHEIYTDEEKAADPSKKLTGLAALPVEKKSRFVLVIAGGGYGAVCSMVEAYPVIKAINEAGYAAFSLHYRVGKAALHPNPVDDVAAAIRYILKNADALNVDGSDYAVMGFSAGGHLAAMFGTEQEGYAKYGLPKPGAVILCYPVITMGEKTHPGSAKRFLGDKAADPAEQDKYSADKLVTAAYPPAFVWQFDSDSLVPVDNSRMMAEALKDNGIPCEYVTYPGTLHGAGIGTGTACEGWLDKALAFWKKQSHF